MDTSRRKHKQKIPFVMVINPIYDSPAWKELSTGARCILLELIRRYKGTNNGYITLSHREAAEVCNGSKSTSQKRFEELQAHGFVKMVNKGVYQNRHATTWLLTFQTDDRNGHQPTHDWKNYTPKKSAVRPQAHHSSAKGTASPKSG